jgi:hypothetical protein
MYNRLATDPLGYWSEQLIILLPLVLVPAAIMRLAVEAADGCCKVARQAAYRHAARIDRDFAKRSTARLRALRGAAPSVWRRALRELARERNAIEDAREALCDSPWATARRARARTRRDKVWNAWFAALERAVAGSGTPPRELLAGNPVRRGAPIRRLCSSSVHAAPDADAVRAQYEKAHGRGRVEEKIRLGSMLLDAEAYVDSSLIRAGDGEIVGRNAGLRGWLFENCPELLPHYATLMGYRRLAAEFRDAHDLGDPCPAELLLAEEPESERRLPPRQRAALPAARRRARQRLKGPEAATAKAFLEKLHRSWSEPRDHRRRLA